MKDNKSWEVFINTIETLSTSQGFYSRLKKQIKELNSDDLKQVQDEIYRQSFKDAVDVILYLEQ